MVEPPLFGLVAGLIALLLVLDPMELPPAEPEPMAPEEAPIELLEPIELLDPMELPDPVEPDDAPMEEELPMLLDASEEGIGEVLAAGGVAAGVVVVVSSAFLPQAPSASTAARATAAAAAGLILDENMWIPLKFEEMDGLIANRIASQISQISI